MQLMGGSVAEEIRSQKPIALLQAGDDNDLGIRGVCGYGAK